METFSGDPRVPQQRSINWFRAVFVASVATGVVTLIFVAIGSARLDGWGGFVLAVVLASAAVLSWLAERSLRASLARLRPATVRFTSSIGSESGERRSGAMHSKTMLRLLLKAIGVWLIIDGATMGVPYLIQLGLDGRGRFWGNALYALAIPLLRLGIGLYLFFGGELIVRLAIPSNRPTCPECGYDVQTLVEGKCPECGERLEEQPATK